MLQHPGKKWKTNIYQFYLNLNFWFINIKIWNFQLMREKKANTHEWHNSRPTKNHNTVFAKQIPIISLSIYLKVRFLLCHRHDWFDWRFPHQLIDQKYSINTSAKQQQTHHIVLFACFWRRNKSACVKLNTPIRIDTITQHSTWIHEFFFSNCLSFTALLSLHRREDM